jgi:ATP-binding cassette subfamily F protein 3
LHGYSEVQDRFRISDGYQIELKVATILRGWLRAGDGCSSSPTISPRLADALALAKLLLSQPTAAARRADQPLDLEAATGSRSISSPIPHAVIVVSHDRYLPRRVVTHIADLSLRTITNYHTNYTKVPGGRDARLARCARQEAAGRRSAARRRVHQPFRYQATKAAQVQSRIKMLAKVERLEGPPERPRIHFQFPASARSGRMVLDLKDVRKAYGEKVVLDHVSLHVERGDRIALVGHNGCRQIDVDADAVGRGGP